MDPLKKWFFWHYASVRLEEVKMHFSEISKKTKVEDITLKQGKMAMGKTYT